MAGYKERLTADLDRWIAGGLVSGDKRQAILEAVPDTRRVDAATALAWVGGILLGIAIIAFIAANWEGLPRLARFASVLGLFLVAAGGAAWTERAGRALTRDVLLTFAALVFAAAIGLTGQIFDIAGDPRSALYMAGAAAALLALAGRSSGAAMASLIFIALGDFNGFDWLGGAHARMPWSVIAAPAGAYLALRWKSAPLAHVASLGIIYSFAWFAFEIQSNSQGASLLFLSVWLAALAAGARWLRSQGRNYATVFYGWFAWAALLFFALAGFADNGGVALSGVVHRLIWLALSGAVIALGRFDRHGLVTAAGVLSLIGAMAGLLMDLGLDLMSAAGVFFICALAALFVGFALRRRAKT